MHTITLTNGKRVGNFSSPHSFEFEDGSILPAVPDKEAERLSIVSIETLHENGDISLKWELSNAVRKEMVLWDVKWCDHKVDVVFIPFPMLQALKEEGYPVKDSPFRVIRTVDRITKKISISKQCI